MKQSAVQWLEKRIHDMIKQGSDFGEDLPPLLIHFEQAKEMDKVTEDTSDGYHTFKELYEFRKVYNAVLFNEWGKIYNGKFEQGIMDFKPKYDVHKSWKHNDGELCFGGGWFIVVAMLSSGQISNHYPASDWDLFKIPEVEKAKYPFDGHTSEDVIERLLNL